VTAVQLAIFAAAVGAGFIDAIAGGSGIIMVPVMIFAGLDPKAAIATNKLINTGGSFTSMLRFARGRLVDLAALGWMLPTSVLGAIAGSQLMSRLDNRFLQPIIVALLVFTTAVTLLRPRFGQHDLAVSPDGRTFDWRRKLLLVLVGGLVGFHDGFFGPGAGIFYTFSLVWITRASFLRGIATSKAINLLTSLIALISFVIAGTIDYSIGVIATLGIVVGAYFGADFATRGGTKVIRPVFLVISFATLVKLVVVPLFS
jgi:uncharacterized membrane protein YfcA